MMVLVSFLETKKIKRLLGVSMDTVSMHSQTGIFRFCLSTIMINAASSKMHVYNFKTQGWTNLVVQ